MAANIPQSIQDTKFINGIDGMSPIDSIADGYVEDLINVSPNLVGELIGRSGSRTQAGLIPLRVEELHYTDDAIDNLILTIAGEPNLNGIAPHAIIVRGRTSVAGNPTNVGAFPNNAITTVLYPTWKSALTRDVVGGTTGTTLTPGVISIAGCMYKTSFAFQSGEMAAIDAQVTTIASGDCAVDIGGDSNAMYSLFAIPVEASATTCWHHTEADVPHSDTTPYTISVTQAVHGIAGTDFQIFTFIESATELTAIQPEAVTIDNDGNVEVQLYQTFSASPIDIRVIIKQSTSAEFGMLLTESLTVLTVDNAISPYFITTVYYRESGKWTEVKPDSVIYNDITKAISITADNIAGIPSAEIKVLTLYMDATTSQIILDATVIGVDFTDTTPELDVYGIDAALFDETFNVNRLLTAYRDAIDETPITVQGKVAYIETATSLTSYPIDMNITTDNGAFDIIRIGPAFTDVASGRTAGYIMHPLVAVGLVTGPTVTAVVDATTVTVRVNLPSYTKIGTPIVAGDLLTMKDMAFAELNGDFVIVSVTYSDVDNIDIVINLPTDTVANASWSMIHGGTVGVFTDKIYADNTNIALFTGDSLTVVGGQEDTMQVVGVDGNTIEVKLSESQIIPTNQRVYGKRTTQILNLGTNALIEGDSIIITRQDTEDVVYRQILASMHGSNFECLSVTGDGAIAIAVITGSVYQYIKYDSTIMLQNLGAFSGAQVVTDINYNGTNTLVSFISEVTGTVTSANGIVWNNTVEVAEVAITDGDTVTCLTRWEALEAFRLTTATRTPQAADFMLTTDEMLTAGIINGNTYVMSQNNYPMCLNDAGHRTAGLPAWNPLLSIRLDNAAGEIYVDPNTISFTALNGRTYTVTAGDEKKILAGDKYAVYNGSTRMGTCIISDVSVSGKVSVQSLHGSLGAQGTIAGSLVRAVALRYYARLRAIDDNNNVIIGPSRGLDDAIVEIDGNQRAVLTLIEPPNLGPFSYSRGVWIDIFRSTELSPDKFYQIATLPCEFITNKPYQMYVDETPDMDLSISDDAGDAITTSFSEGLSSYEFLQPPQRCGSVATLGNRLIQANIIGDAGVNLSVLSANGMTAGSFNTATVTLTPSTGSAQVYEFTSNAIACTVASVTDHVASLSVASGTFTTGDWVFVSTTSSANPGPCGWFKLKSATGSAPTITLTIDVPVGVGSGASGYVNRASVGTSIPVPTGLSYGWDTTTGNLESISAPRGMMMRRLGLAIQAANTVLNPVQSFWADAGDSFGTGEINVYSKAAATVAVSLSTIKFAVDGVLGVNAQVYNLTEKVWPSRILLSALNYPECFIGTNLIHGIKGGQSVIDVNPSDGDEIVAIKPLLATSMFSASTQEQVLIVFKRRAIYAVDIGTFIKGGGSYIQQITVNGVGCISSTGIASLDTGLLFPGPDTIYLLDKSLVVTPVGNYINRQLMENTYGSQVLTATSLQDGYIADGTNVYVYQPAPIAWSRWVLPKTITTAERIAGYIMFGTQGRVITMDTALASDDAADIEQQVTFRASGFGDSTMLKSISEIHLNMNTQEWTPGVQESVVVEYATELRRAFNYCTIGNVNGPAMNELSVVETPRRMILRYACPAKKFQVMQVRVTLTATQQLSISNLTYKVQGLSQSGKGTIEVSDY